MDVVDLLTKIMSYMHSAVFLWTSWVQDWKALIVSLPFPQTILGDFVKEQGKFVTENTDKKKLNEAAIPPWIGYNEEKAMKKQILALSSVGNRRFTFRPSVISFCTH